MKKTDPKISKHFSKLGKKSWESRKAKLLGEDLETPKKKEDK